MQRMKKFTTLLMTIIFIFVAALSMSGCAENADTYETEYIPDYSTVCQEFEDYRIAYSSYREEQDNDISELHDGYTTDEIPCTVRYSSAADGTYRIATLEASRDIDGNEITVTDEYYAINDNEMIIVRAYIDAAGTLVFSKYVVIGTTLYSLNDETSELIQEQRPDSFDFYLAFDEIEALYGGQS